ncbi:MAG: damage-inducible protein CinA, partial [Deltaproteobacteria bacterium]|nr:damage-inducible protein CinA [Deltaproteobacteria bacterium]
MIAEILSTGEEIRRGTIIDSNTAHIAEKLETLGVHVARHLSVGDDTEELVSIFNETGNRADVAIVTGGLGPTQDDLTAEAAAKAANDELVLDTPAFEAIKRYFEERHRPMAPSNKKQAMLP